MSSVKVFVGLDYHDQQVQVCVLNQERKLLCNRSVPNDVRQIMAAASRCGKVLSAAVEACGGSAHLAQELNNAGWSVSLAHPGIVARMKQNPDKTDYTDARMLADLLAVGYLPKVWLAPERLRCLRRLVRYRQQLVDEQRNIKLRIRALLRENRLRPGESFSPWTKKYLHWLKEADLGEEDRWLLDQHLDGLARVRLRITEAEERLQAWAQNDAVVEKLLTFHGVGLITAITMRAEIGQFDRFQNGKQLARYCGVTPRNASSGQRQADAGLIKAGNPQLRQVLIQLAHRLICRGPDKWRFLAAGMLKRGKKKNVVVAAIANRWVRWLHHQMLPGALSLEPQSSEPTPVV